MIELASPVSELLPMTLSLSTEWTPLLLQKLSKNMAHDSTIPPKHVVIVGGGMAGLIAARELMKLNENDAPLKVTLVEASEYLGGRIKGNSTFIPNHVVDVGAEYIHGKSTLLTDLIDEFVERGEWKHIDQVTREAFIAAHADGGPFPSSGYTQDGYYGRYYMNKELMEGNDARLEPLHKVLATLDDDEETCNDTTVSIGSVLKKRLGTNGKDAYLYNMAIAGYANTAGCTNLDEVSLHMLCNFEEHWQENEDEGDLHMDSRIGISGLIKALVDELSSRSEFESKLNWQLVEIEQQNESGVVEVVSSDGKTIQADAVIITVPPPILPTISGVLNEKKQKALQYIGFEPAVKLILKFSERLWPSKLESLICADCLVPEMWFQEYKSGDDDDDEITCYTATCFLTSDTARRFVERITNDDGNPCNETAARLVMEQLSTILEVPVESFRNAYMDSLLYDWSTHSHIRGGYMYPKVGLTRQHLHDLAAPDSNLFFAGEATNVNACCTIQAAMETGVRAAKQVQEHLYS